MIRLTLTALAALLIAPAAQAADDGGFGSERFSSQSPAALSGEAENNAFAKSEEANPAAIEPAAGVEEDKADIDTRDPEAIADDPDAEERPPAE